MTTATKRSATRQKLEDTWRLRLEEIQARYERATEQYKRLLQEQPDGRPPDPKSALALVRQAQSEALAEYRRVLWTFTELTVSGTVPEERSAAGAGSL